LGLNVGGPNLQSEKMRHGGKIDKKRYEGKRTKAFPRKLALKIMHNTVGKKKRQMRLKGLHF